MTNGNQQRKNNVEQLPDNLEMEATHYEPNRSDSIAQQRLDQEDTFVKLKHKLRGEEMTIENGQITWKQRANPLCNETGINRIFNRIDGIVNANTILSRFTSNEIANRMELFHKNLAVQLVLNRQRFEINKNDLKDIVDLVTDTIWATLKRAQGGGESDAISGSTQTVERTIKQKDDESGGSRFPFLSGGD